MECSHFIEPAIVEKLERFSWLGPLKQNHNHKINFRCLENRYSTFINNSAHSNVLCLFLKEANFFIIHDIKSILQGMQRKKKISNGEKKKEKKKKVTTLQ